MNPYFERLKKLTESKSYVKLFFMKSIWNLSGRKFQALFIIIILAIFKLITINQLYAALLAYGGLNVAEKYFSSRGR